MSTAQAEREEGCFGITFERKYYQRDQAFIKRSLRPSEYCTGPRGPHVPRLGKERLVNEAASLRFVRNHTDIPVPRLYCDFEDDGAYYLITEYIEGVGMSDLAEAQKAIVRTELEQHLAKLRALKSCKLGGPTGIVIPPYRLWQHTESDAWGFVASKDTGYVFCHNDLSQENVVVDPDTLKITAIVDWEFAGFYPARFEFPFCNRLGPSVALDGESDDSLELLEFLKSKNAVARDEGASDSVTPE